MDATSNPVVIGFVHGGTVRAEFMASVIGVLAARRPPVFDVLAVKSGPNISRARNKLVSRFLDTGAAWLLMADTDMVFGPDTLARLVGAADPVERPIVGALCFAEHETYGQVPTAYQMREVPGGGVLFHPAAEWPEDTCWQVDATGAGCLLVHRRALADIREAADDRAAPWFRETAAGGILIGEDLTFCARAAMAGIPVHVHTGIQVGHIKTIMLGKADGF